MKVLIVLALTLIGTNMSVDAVKICEPGYGDIIFVLETDVGTQNFTLQKEFVADVTAALEPADILFGALLFHNSTTRLFDLGSDLSQKEIVQTLEEARYTAGDTNTHLGLKLAQRMMTRARPTATKVVIVITGHESAIPSETKKAAINLKNTNVTSLVIGVEDTSRSELLDIASQPDYVFEVNSYVVISTIKNDLIQTVEDVIAICTDYGKTDPPSPPCPNGEVIGSQCFTFNSQRMTQADAADSCAANGGEIFAVKSEEMYKRLGGFAKDKGVKLWAGAKEAAEGDWRWISDKSPANIQKKWFQRGEPNNWRGNEECLQMQPNGKLNDASCCKRFAFVCVSGATSINPIPH